MISPPRSPSLSGIWNISGSRALGGNSFPFTVTLSISTAPGGTKSGSTLSDGMRAVRDPGRKKDRNSGRRWEKSRIAGRRVHLPSGTHIGSNVGVREVVELEAVIASDGVPGLLRVGALGSPACRRPSPGRRRRDCRGRGSTDSRTPSSRGQARDTSGRPWTHGRSGRRGSPAPAAKSPWCCSRRIRPASRRLACARPRRNSRRGSGRCRRRPCRRRAARRDSSNRRREPDSRSDFAFSLVVLRTARARPPGFR